MNSRATRGLEKLAEKLSIGIIDGEIDNKLIKRTNDYLDSVKSDQSYELRASEVYILYETEALLRWCEGREKDAYRLISEAFVVKGDGELYTDTGKGLLANVEEPLVSSRIKNPMAIRTQLLYAAFIIILPLISLILLALDGKYSGLDKLKALLWTIPIIAIFSFIIAIGAELVSI